MQVAELAGGGGVAIDRGYEEGDGAVGVDGKGRRWVVVSAGRVGSGAISAVEYVEVTLQAGCVLCGWVSGWLTVTSESGPRA